MVILQLEEQPPIIQAIFADAVEEIKELIEYKQDVNCLDCEKRTPLHAAAHKGDSTIASLLISSGARVNAKDSKWVTPLHRACSMGSDDTVALLLENQADVSARDRLWQTPLHIAAANDAYNCVEMLLDYVPNPNVTDRSGRTALHHAAYNGNTAVVELLISRGCIVNACDKKDCRPLHCAMQTGNMDTVAVLLKYGADVNSKDRNQYTPLHVAAASDSSCRELLNHGAQVDSQNIYGNTPLHIACLNGHVSICHDLVSFGANVEATNFRGQTPLHIAAASTPGVDCLMYLLSEKVDINRQSLDGRTPLHMTAIHGRFTRSKTLIDNGAIIDCPDKNGCTPLHIAAQYGHDLLSNTLLAYGADPSKKGTEGRTPLHMCCLSGYVECCRKFLQAGVDLNAQDDSGKTPIHCAAYKGSVECLDLLVSNGANFLMCDALNRLPLHYAASQGHYQCVFTLVGIGSPTNAADAEGCTPLHLAAAYDTEGKCVEYLLNHRADPTLKDNRGFTALHYAIAGGNTNGVSLLLTLDRLRNPVVGEKEGANVTPQHLAAKLGNIDILRSVLTYYHDVNIQTDQGITPLILAAREGHAQCVHFLLRFGAKVALSDHVQKMTPVHYSAKNGHSQCLSLLLHNSEDPTVVNMLDRQQRTALMLAVSGNHLECVQTLLKCGADPNIVDADRHTCLFRAVVNGQNSIVQLLLSSNARVQEVDVNGKTVLHLAAACGHFVCLQMILGYMKDEDALVLDNQQCNALHWVCYNGHSNCLEYLLERNVFKTLEGNSFSPVHCATFSGSEKCLELLVSHFGSDIVNLKDSRQRTPLHIAALHGHVDCAKYLLDQGGDVHVTDEEGRTPLIAAAQFGQSQTVELLLSYKVDRTAPDKQGNTALHWACMKKHSHTALLILEDTNDPSVINSVNNEKKTPLHMSARNGLVDVTRELLKKGASVLAVDQDGLTPALCCAPNNSVAQCLALILRSLPEFLANCAVENDPLCLIPFYDYLSRSEETRKSNIFKSEQTQTKMSLIHDPDIFEIKRLFGVRFKPQHLYKETSSSPPGNHQKNLVVDDDKLFVIENEDFDEDLEETSTKNLSHGLNLHKSYSDMSIACNMKYAENFPPKVKLSDVSERKKNCRECFRLQHRCPDCTIAHVLRQHMQGKTSAKEFNELFTKSLQEASADYRQKCMQALDVIGKKVPKHKGQKKTQKTRSVETLCSPLSATVFTENPNFSSQVEGRSKVDKRMSLAMTRIKMWEEYNRKYRKKHSSGGSKKIVELDELRDVFGEGAAVNDEGMHKPTNLDVNESEEPEKLLQTEDQTTRNDINLPPTCPTTQQDVVETNDSQQIEENGPKNQEDYRENLLKEIDKFFETTNEMFKELSEEDAVPKLVLSGIEEKNNCLTEDLKSSEKTKDLAKDSGDSTQKDPEYMSARNVYMNVMLKKFDNLYFDSLKSEENEETIVSSLRSARIMDEKDFTDPNTERIGRKSFPSDANCIEDVVKISQCLKNELNENTSKTKLTVTKFLNSCDLYLFDYTATDSEDEGAISSKNIVEIEDEAGRIEEQKLLKECLNNVNCNEEEEKRDTRVKISEENENIMKIDDENEEIAIKELKSTEDDSSREKSESSIENMPEDDIGFIPIIKKRSRTKDLNCSVM